MGSRDAFLEQVRRAVTQGNRAGAAVPLEPRGQVGYQGAGADPVATFREQFLAAGGLFHAVDSTEAAARTVLEIVQGHAARRVLLGRGTYLDPLGLAERLPSLGAAVIPAADQPGVPVPEDRDAWFAADVGVSGVHALIAETGSLVVLTRHDEPRSLSLLPPVHIAVAHRRQLIPDLFDLFESKLQDGGAGTPSCLTLITGPSKTGDIELRLVTGVHGPGEVHVVLIEG